MLIETCNSKPNGNYGLLVGVEMGKLFSQIHSAMIKCGYILENIIEDLNLDSRMVFTTKIRVGTKSDGKPDNIKPDFFFDRSEDIEDPVIVTFEKDNVIDIQEWKLGTNFDTKKSAGEIISLLKLAEHFEKQGRKVRLGFMSYTAENKDVIRKGLKGKLPDEIIPITGRELAEDLGFDYESVLEQYKKDQEANRNYIAKRVNEITR